MSETNNPYTQTIMSHNAETGLLVCQVPYETEVLRINEPDFAKAKKISDAIQKAYSTGKSHGMNTMSCRVEDYMATVNRE